VRISVLSFRFAASDKVFVWCEALRCAAQPCGECGSERRLSEDAHIARRLQGDRQLLQSWLRAPTLPQVVLPGPISLDVAQLVWKLPATSTRGGLAVQSNITLWGSQANVSKAFLDALASAIASQMSRIFLRQLDVTKIFSPGSALRLLASRSVASSSSAQALIAECLVVVAGQEELVLVMAKFASLHRDGAAADFGQSLQASIGIPTRIRVDFGPATVNRATEVNSPAEKSPEGEAGMPIDQGLAMGPTLFVAFGALMFIIGCACALGAALCWWKMCLPTPTPNCIEVEMQNPRAKQAVESEVDMQNPPEPLAKQVADLEVNSVGVIRV